MNISKNSYLTLQLSAFAQHTMEDAAGTFLSYVTGDRALGWLFGLPPLVGVSVAALLGPLPGVLVTVVTFASITAMCLVRYQEHRRQVEQDRRIAVLRSAEQLMRHYNDLVVPFGETLQKRRASAAFLVEVYRLRQDIQEIVKSAERDIREGPHLGSDEVTLSTLRLDRKNEAEIRRRLAELEYQLASTVVDIRPIAMVERRIFN